jgi:hypothetical protein
MPASTLPALSTPRAQQRSLPPPNTAAAQTSRSGLSTADSVLRRDRQDMRSRISTRGRHIVDDSKKRLNDLSHLFDDNSAGTMVLPQPAGAAPSEPLANPMYTSDGVMAPPELTTLQPTAPQALKRQLMDQAKLLSRVAGLPTAACLATHYKLSTPHHHHEPPKFADGDLPQTGQAFPAALPTSRADAIASIASLEEALAQAGEGADVLDRLNVYDASFVDVIRQVLVGCSERGVLLEYLRVSMFSCVNVLLERVAHAEHTAETSTAAAAKYCGRITELESSEALLREQLAAEKRSSKRKEILDITSAAKRSKEYVEYATAHFTRFLGTVEQEAKDAEVKNKYFSLALSANASQKETMQRYQEALEEVRSLQVREERLAHQLAHALDDAERYKVYLDKLKAVLGEDRLVESLRLASSDSRSFAAVPLTRNAASGGDHAVADTRDTAVDTTDLSSSPPTSPIGRSTRGVSFASGALPRRATFIPNAPSSERRKSTFVPVMARSRYSGFGATFIKKKEATSSLPPPLLSDDDDDDCVPHVTVDVEVQATFDASDVTGVGVHARQMLADVMVDSETDALTAVELRSAGLIADANTQTTDSSLVAPSARTPLHDDAVAPLAPRAEKQVPKQISQRDSCAFDHVLRRLALDKAKTRPTKWVISTVSHMLNFIMEREPLVTRDTDVSATAVLYFRHKYGLERLSDQYIAEFVVNARRELPSSRRIACWARFVGLHQFFRLAESLPTSTGPQQTSVVVGGDNGGRLAESAPAEENASVSWAVFAHYAFLSAAVKKLVPRKSLKDLEESDSFAMPAEGAFALLTHAYKKRLSEKAMRTLCAALNAWDRSKLDPFRLAPLLQRPPSTTISRAEPVVASIDSAWPVNLLLEVLVFSTHSLFPFLCGESDTELSALGVTNGVDDARMWNPQL